MAAAVVSPLAGPIGFATASILCPAILAALYFVEFLACIEAATVVAVLVIVPAASRTYPPRRARVVCGAAGAALVLLTIVCFEALYPLRRSSLCLAGWLHCQAAAWLIFLWLVAALCGGAYVSGSSCARMQGWVLSFRGGR